MQPRRAPTAEQQKAEAARRLAEKKAKQLLEAQEEGRKRLTKGLLADVVDEGKPDVEPKHYRLRDLQDAFSAAEGASKGKLLAAADHRVNLPRVLDLVSINGTLTVSGNRQVH